MRTLAPLCLLFAVSCFGADLAANRRPLSLAFEAREGGYVSHGPGYSLSVTPSGALLNLSGHALRLGLQGAESGATLEPLDRMPGRTNYFLGRNVRRSYELYGRVRSSGVYPGIDLVFHGNQDRLEYDFEIAAGRDPERIQIGFEGADEIRIDPSGDLVLAAGELEIHQPTPVAYQALDGHKTLVTVAYQLEASNLVKFRIGPYDRSRALVIDPQLVFKTVFGGSGSSSAADVTLDAEGNIYAAGQTSSAGFPVQNAAQNHPGAAPLLASVDGGATWTAPALGNAGPVLAIASAPSSAAVLYAAASAGVIKSMDGGATWTALSNTGLTAPPIAIAVDAASANTVYAATAGAGVFISTDGGANWTQSTNGLMVQGSTPPSLVQLWGLFASPSQAGLVFAVAQAPDFMYRSTDSGHTWAQSNFPPGHSPAALVFSPTDSKTIYLGEAGGEILKSTDSGVTWTTVSSQVVWNPQALTIVPGNPLVLIASDGGGVSRSSDGGLTWTKTLTIDYGIVAADPRNAGVVYTLGFSGLYRSADTGKTWTKTALPYVEGNNSLFVSPSNSRILAGEGAQTDAFVTKWSPDGKQILYSTFLGGSGLDSATGIAVDATGSAYVLGMTNSPDFPVTKNAIQKTNGGAFVAKLSPDGSQLVYSTLLGAGSEVSGRIAVDRAGEAVVVGGTPGPNFPVTTGAFQHVPNGAICTYPSYEVATSGTAFVTKLAADGGSLIFSTLLGGSCGTTAQAVALDANGDAWVAGLTDSPDFPVTKDALQPALGGGTYDAFLARFNPTGTLAYSTYVGGAGYDTATGITFDQKGNLYLTGTTTGLSQPASVGAFQSSVTGTCLIFTIGPAVYQAVGNAFVLKLDSAAHTVLGLTYLGSPLCLYPSDIAVDATGEPWIGGTLGPFGSAPQTAIPLQIGIGNGFVSKFSADFTQLLFSTYFDIVFGLVVDSAGDAIVAGGAADIGDTQPAFVAKIDATPPAISFDSVQSSVNPASIGPVIAPGEVLRLLGKNMGPAQTTAGIVNGGALETEVAGVQVIFDGAAVPLLSVSAGEIDLVAPFELSGKTVTTIQVRYNGAASNPVQVAVSPTALQVLGIFNQDFTPNSAANPAQAGSMMMLYVSGAGQTVPPSQDGQVNSVPLAGAPKPVQISAIAGNSNNPTIFPIAYAGAAPDLIAGIFQINFVAPAQSVANVSITVGGGTGSFNVYVK